MTSHCKNFALVLSSKLQFYPKVTLVRHVWKYHAFLVNNGAHCTLVLVWWDARIVSMNFLTYFQRVKSFVLRVCRFEQSIQIMTLRLRSSNSKPSNRHNTYIRCAEWNRRNCLIRNKSDNRYFTLVNWCWWYFELQDGLRTS